MSNIIKKKCPKCNQYVRMIIPQKDYRHTQDSMDVHNSRFCSAIKREYKRVKYHQIIAVKRCLCCNSILLKRKSFYCKKCKKDIPYCFWNCKFKDFCVDYHS